MLNINITFSLTRIKIMWFLFLTMGTSSFSFAQNEEELDDLDILLDRILFNEDQFVDDILEDAYRYNILYSSVTFNSNTYYYGRENEVDQFNLSPQISYSSSFGLVAGVSGIYFDKYEPNWSHTNISVGYFNYIGKKELIRYYGGYTHTFFSDGWDSLTNSIDGTIGLRNKKRTLGVKVNGNYLFGKGQSYLIVAEAYGNFTLIKRKKYKIKHRPSVNIIFGQQLLYTNRYYQHENHSIEEKYNGLMNTQINLPFYLVTKSWDFEIGYTINFPQAFESNTSPSPTGFLSISVGYLIDFSR